MLTEHDDQRLLFLWSEQNQDKYPCLDLLYAVPNGGARDEITGARLKEEGVKPGVSDVCLPVARGGFHGLYVEMKRAKGGRLSKDQAKFQRRVREEGYCAVVAAGYQEGIAAIENYLEVT